MTDGRTPDPHSDERILVLAPTGRDAVLAAETLRSGGLTAHVCADVENLSHEVERGVGALLLTQEALTGAALEHLLAAIERQPPWSDVPSIVLVSGGAGTPASAHLADVLGERANATLLERPVRAATLVGALRVALRARRRQYELRDRLSALSTAEAGERDARAAAEQAGRVRDQFVASVAHDLKHPLAAIKGYAQLLRRQLTRTGAVEVEKLAEALSTIDDMATRATGQLDDLIDLARLQSNQSLALVFRPVDLVSLARRAVAEHRHTAPHHRVRLDAAVEELLGVWDERRLERVLTNLLSNATKYSPSESEVVVEIGHETAPDTGRESAVIAVRDSGIGIPPEDLPRLFEHYFRASNVQGRVPGVGLGLAGARHIVEQHGGTIDVTSTLGQGSTFTIRLPVVPPRSSS